MLLNMNQNSNNQPNFVDKHINKKQLLAFALVSGLLIGRSHFIVKNKNLQYVDED